MSINTIKELFLRADASGSRSTILQPLMGFTAIIFGGLTLALKAKAPNWLIIVLAVFLGMFILLAFIAYTYCLFKDRDAIRSEKYSIQKMAIEKGLYGDSNLGVFNYKQSEPSKENLEIANSEEDQN